MLAPAGITGARDGVRRGAAWCVITIVVACDLAATGWLGLGERAVGVARTMVFPGLGFVEWNPLLSSFFIVIAFGAVAAWLRWGTDWIVVVVWVTATALAAFVMPLHHGPPEGEAVLRSSHEFGAVLVLIAVISRVRLVVMGLPGLGHRSDASSGPTIAPVDRARASAVDAIARRAGAADVDRVRATDALAAPALCRRAKRINLWARLRRGPDPFRFDNAPVRAALSLWGEAGDDGGLAGEAARRRVGVPSSEPTWVRPLDGMLAAIALDEMGQRDAVERWLHTFDLHFRLRHGRRRGCLHTPSMFGLGTARPWEHASATALARYYGWLGDLDWTHLRRRCLGAAARGASTTEDARLVAAGRIWATIVGDDEASKILRRPSLAADPLAVALDRLARQAAASIASLPPSTSRRARNV